MANKFGMFLIGGVVGAVAALLAAPRSGAETRAMVADKAGEFAGNAQQWGDSAAAGAQHIYQEAATKGAEVVNNVTAVARSRLRGRRSRGDVAAHHPGGRQQHLPDDQREGRRAAQTRLKPPVSALPIRWPRTPMPTPSAAETVKDVAETAKEAAKDAAATAEEGAKETAAEVKEAAGEVAKAAEGKKDEK